LANRFTPDYFCRPTYVPAVADGYWLLVTPLTPGEHTIYFKGINNAGFTVEVTYFLTVQP
jgi:hypothetical protein